MEDLRQFKKQYNDYIKRLNKAIEYFETAPPAEAEKWVKTFNDLVFQSGEILIKIRSQGQEVTPDEILNGFK